MTCHNNIFLRGDLFRYVSHKAKSFPSNILEFVPKKYLNLLEKKTRTNITISCSENIEKEQKIR